MSKDETSRYSKFKSSVRKKFNKLSKKPPILRSNKNIWTRNPQEDGDCSTSALIQNRFEKMFAIISSALIAKKDQEFDLAVKILKGNKSTIEITNGNGIKELLNNENKDTNPKKLDNKYFALNILAWPYALWKTGIWLLNISIDGVDKIIHHVDINILKLIKYLTPFYLADTHNELEKLIGDIKKNGSLLARVTKLIINLAEIIPAKILSVPIHVAREIDAWLDKQPKSAGKNTTPNVDNTAAPDAEAEQAPTAAPTNVQAHAAKQTVGAPAATESEITAEADDFVADSKEHSEVPRVHQATVQTTVEFSRDVQQNNPVKLEQGQEQEQKVELQQKRTEAEGTSTQEFGGTAYNIIALCGGPGLFASKPKITEAEATTTLHQRGPSFAA